MAAMVARVIVTAKFVKLDKIHCSTCIFVTLTLFSIEFKTC